MQATRTVPRLTTTGVMATKLGVPLHRVLHILATRPHIQPAARAGNLRLYNREALAMVRQELDAIDARRDRQIIPHEHGNALPRPFLAPLG